MTILPASYKWAWASLAFSLAGMACITKAVMEEYKERKNDDKWLKATLGPRRSSSFPSSQPPQQSPLTESD